MMLRLPGSIELSFTIARALRSSSLGSLGSEPLPLFAVLVFGLCVRLREVIVRAPMRYYD